MPPSPQAGLPDDVVECLMAGTLPEGLSEQEKVASRFTRQLVAERRVDAELHRLAEAAFGPQGLVDIIFLAGIYQLVCGLLTAFEISAPATGSLNPSQPDQHSRTRKGR